MQKNFFVSVVDRRSTNRHLALQSVLKIDTRDEGEVHIVRVSGIVDMNAAGPLCDALVAAVKGGHRSLVAEISGVSHMTRAGARGFVVAAKLMQAARGDMRIAGAAGLVRELLRNLGYRHLLKCDTTVAEALDRLSANDNLPPRAEVRPRLAASV